ncbi:hypothetical protein SAMN05446635_5355 [Burkholderia sp. OK233]|nr:hypothetical protein SAMN05446635_5355 [Burkholderia sp. OK233]
MKRTYEYHGYTLVVAVESDSSWRLGDGAAARAGYVAIVRIFQAAMLWRYFRRCASVRPAAARLRQKQML